LKNRRVSAPRSRAAGPFTARSNGTNRSVVRSASTRFQSAQRSYERYLALAQEEVRSGNVVGAENYYQHAEHYFRLMSSDREAT
jgi:Domain of unknown function (DUF4167)